MAMRDTPRAGGAAAHERTGAGVTVYVIEAGSATATRSSAAGPAMGSTSSGTIRTSQTTPGDDSSPGSVEPTIDRFNLTGTSNRQFARVLVNRAVSGENLQSVVVNVAGDGNVATRTWSLSGTSATGQHEFSFRGGHRPDSRCTDAVSLRVTYGGIEAQKSSGISAQDV
jgi:hypothetical protein